MVNARPFGRACVMRVLTAYIAPPVPPVRVGTVIDRKA